MPYSFESNHKLIPEQFDRRCKLTSIQKQEIVKKYETGSYSLNSLAKEYEVSKKTMCENAKSVCDRNCESCAWHE